MVSGLLAAGFTTIRDPGDLDLDRAHFDVHDATDAGVFIGPRVIGADRFVMRTGGLRLLRDARAAGSDGARAHLLVPTSYLNRFPRSPMPVVRVPEAVAFVMRGGVVVSADGSRAAP